MLIFRERRDSVESYKAESSVCCVAKWMLYLIAV